MNRPPLPADTSSDAFAHQLGALRRRGIEGRAEMTIQLCDNLRKATESGIRHRHPEYDEAEVRSALIRLTVGEEIYRTVVSSDAPPP